MIRGKKFEIDQRKVYQIGICAFAILTIMNTATIFQTYKAMIATQLISTIASNVFNYALFGFFFYLYRQLPPKIEKPVTEGEMASILKQAVEKTK